MQNTDDRKLHPNAMAPTPLVLDASVMDYHELAEVARENMKQNKIRFLFPSGFAKVPLKDECRALTMLDDFDTMYDLVMMKLENKDLVIELQTDAGWLRMTEIHVTDKFMDLRGDAFIDKYPVVVTWLTEFVAEDMLKKFPTPGSVQDAPHQVSTKNKAAKEGRVPRK